MTEVSVPHLWKAGGEPLPYNAKLGTFWAPAYSNRDDDFFSGQKKFTDGVHTGFAWQCVEYARRYTVLRKGLAFESCVRASEIHLMKKIKKVETDEEVDWLPIDNGSTQKPELGSVIVWPYHDQLLPWGHVGLISYVQYYTAEEIAEGKRSAFDAGKTSGLAAFTGRDGTGEVIGFVGIAEQNVENYPWGERSYGRAIPIVQRGENYFLEEPLAPKKILDPMGWHPLPASIPDRDDPSQPLVPKTAASLVQKPFLLRWKMDHNVPDWDQLLNSEEQGKEENKSSKPPPSRALGYWRDQNLPINFTAVLSPQAEMGEKFVGACHYAMDAAKISLEFLLKTVGDDELAEWFELPKEVIPKLRAGYVAEDGNLDIHGNMFGTVDFSFANGEAVLSSFGLDGNLAGFLELTLQDHICQRNNRVAGFSPCTVNNDCRRALIHYSKLARKVLPGGEKVTTLHIVDTASEGNHHERAQNLRLFESFQKVIEDAKSKEEEECDEVAQFSVKFVAASSLRWSDGADGGERLVVDADGQIVRLVRKTSPWSSIFAQQGVTSDLVSMLLSPHILTYEPLWASIVSHRNFLTNLFQMVDQGTFVTAAPSKTQAEEIIKCLGLHQVNERTRKIMQEHGQTVFSTKAAYLPDTKDYDAVENHQFFVTRFLACSGYFAAVIPLERAQAVSVENGEENTILCCPEELDAFGCFRFIFDVPEDETNQSTK